jgi:hypothetical protein
MSWAIPFVIIIAAMLLAAVLVDRNRRRHGVTKASGPIGASRHWRAFGGGDNINDY